MKYIPCTIEFFRDKSENCWIIRVPEHAVKDAAKRFSELLSDTRKRIVFLDRKTEFVLTAETATYNTRSIRITGDFLECLEKLFSTRHTDHIDYDFSDQHGDVTITVFIK